MSQCKEIQKQITAWLDGELERQLHSTVKRHLGDCPSCSEALRMQQRERLWLNQHNLELEPRPELWFRIQRALREEAAPQKPAWPARIWNLLYPGPIYAPIYGMTRILAGAALAALLAISGLWVFTLRETAPDPAADQQVRQLMENYVHWRQSQKLFELPGISTPATSIDELRMANPFSEEKSKKTDGNPFEI